MKTSLTGALAALACLGMVAQPALAAGPAAPTAVPNVKLTDAGALKGRVADGSGRPMAEQTVSVVKAGKLVAQASTDAQGVYAVEGVAPGSYVLSVGNKAAHVRVWDAQAAPAKSMNEAVLMAGDAVRGQYADPSCPPGGYEGGGFFGGIDFITLATVGSAVTAAVLAGIAVSEINDANDSIDQLNERIDDLEGELGNGGGAVTP